MSLLEGLRDLEIKEDVADRLKQQELPLVMWGAGEIADEVYHYLKINDIDLADVFVDDAYHSEDMMFQGKEVLSLSMLKKKYAEANVILGCSNYEKIRHLEQYAFVNEVFYLFSYSYGIYEKTDLSEIEENIDEFEQVGRLFADDLSYQNYLAFLKTRISGDNSHILDVLGRESNYFNNDVFKIGSREVFLDIGAYNGDTIRLFLKENNGQYHHIYALEPDGANRRMLERYIEESGLQDVTVSGMAPWKENGELHFVMNDNGQLSSLVFNGIDKIEGIQSGVSAKPLDEMFSYDEPITLIKINYLEGVREALQGAEHILRDHRPKLAVSVGFDCNNIRSIPMLIKSSNPDYKLYLRYNRGTISTLTCYGVV